MFFENINKETAYKILASRELEATIEELTEMELENYFDRSILLFDETITKEELAECGILKLGEKLFSNLMMDNVNKTVFEMLIVEGYLTVVDGIHVFSMDYKKQMEGETNECISI